MTWGSAVGGTMQAAASAYGAYLASKSAKKQRKEQRKFAQYGVRWRVADAIAAGLHPLAALGAQVTQYQPVHDQTGEMIGQMGQGIGQAVGGAIDAYSSKKAREQQIESNELDIEYKHLRNDRALMENMGYAGAGPYAMSELNRQSIIQGQGTDAVRVQASTPTAEKPGTPGGMEAGNHPGEMFAKIPTSKHGVGYIPTLTQQLTESMEDNLMFKMPYYGMKLEEYWQAYQAAWKGDKSGAWNRWINFWSQYLPKPARGYRWDWSPIGYFYQTSAPRQDPWIERTGKKFYDYYRLEYPGSEFIGP